MTDKLTKRKAKFKVGQVVRDGRVYRKIREVKKVAFGTLYRIGEINMEWAGESDLRALTKREAGR